MNDEWRVTIRLHGHGPAGAVAGYFEGTDLDHDLSVAFHDTVIVTHTDSEVFLYAGSRQQAEGAKQVAERVLSERGDEADVELTRWHPIAEEWEDPDTPLPADVEAKIAEHKALMETERREYHERGTPEFEVRIDLPSHHEAVRFAKLLKSEGWPLVHRWRFILIGAEDEDEAKEILAKIKPGVPEGDKIAVEGTWAMAYAERPENNAPFRVLYRLGI
jgi:hypothetical protein